MKTLLLIEDDELFRKSLVQIIQDLDYTVLEACDGREGLSLYRRFKPDIVVTDLIMPEKEGIETIRELRLLSASLPIIAISGGGRGQAVDYLALASHSGATCVLSKPFGLAEFSQALAQCPTPQGTS
jgi:CheY-like chemotaxis protein